MRKWITTALAKLKARLAKAPAEPATFKPTQEPGQSFLQETHPTPAPVSKLKSLKPQTKVALLIGLDFGTHSTKVVVRRRGERQGRVVALDVPVSGYPPYAIPSLVRAAEGALWFGGEALNRGDGVLYRLLKLELIKTTSLVNGEQSNVDLLVTAYFAWILGAVRKWVDEEYGLENCKLFLNVAAPMDHFEIAQIKKRYLAILATAWEWTFGPKYHHIRQAVALNDVKSWMETDQVLIPNAAVRTYDVLPETIAPIVSLSQDPRMNAGMYLLIDMGAGTTELSINFVSVPGGEQNVLCYFDRSILLGAEKFLAGEKQRELLALLLKNIWQTWYLGYEKDAQNYAARQRWKSLRILLLGGGTCRKDVCDAINAEHHAVFTRFPGEARCEILRHGPADLQFPASKVSQEDISLASVANGLAFPRMQWPKFYEPAQIEPIEGTAAQNAADPWYLDR